MKPVVSGLDEEVEIVEHNRIGRTQDTAHDAQTESVKKLSAEDRAKAYRKVFNAFASMPLVNDSTVQRGFLTCFDIEQKIDMLHQTAGWALNALSGAGIVASNHKVKSKLKVTGKNGKDKTRSVCAYFTTGAPFDIEAIEKAARERDLQVPSSDELRTWLEGLADEENEARGLRGKDKDKVRCQDKASEFLFAVMEGRYVSKEDVDKEIHAAGKYRRMVINDCIRLSDLYRLKSSAVRAGYAGKDRAFFQSLNEEALFIAHRFLTRLHKPA